MGTRVRLVTLERPRPHLAGAVVVDIVVLLIGMYLQFVLSFGRGCLLG